MMVSTHDTYYIQLIYPFRKPIGKICEQWILQKGGWTGCDGSHIYIENHIY